MKKFMSLAMAAMLSLTMIACGNSKLKKGKRLQLKDILKCFIIYEKMTPLKTVWLLACKRRGLESYLLIK